MKARLVILVVLAAALAVYFAGVKGKEPVVDTAFESGLTKEEESQTQADKRLLSERPLPGREPAVRPKAPEDFAVTIEVDPSGKKNRLYFTISERHGYYIETMRIIAWRTKGGTTDPEDSPLVVPVYVNDYIKANETLRWCAEVVPAELARVGGDLGTTADWAARVEYFHRAREKHPDPLPSVLRMVSCD